jgi:gliding motility-associated-like protein
LKYIATLLVFCGLLPVESFSQSPTPDFKADITSGCSPIIVNFTDLSTGGATSWQWDFGNGATSTRQNPSTTFISPGTYTIRLTATNLNGSNTMVKTGYVTVFPEPTAAFTSNRTSGCAPVVIQFTDQSTPTPGTTITQWKWDFGDGIGTSTLQNPQYRYKDPGSYTVTLTITTDKGCTKLITKPNYINATTGVVPSFTYTDPSVCSAPSTVSFSNGSTGPGSLSYFWNFGNGNTSTAQNPTNYYTTNGIYNVSLAVTSDQGCTDTAKMAVQIGKVLTDFIIPASICPRTVTTFQNNSTPRPLRSLWKFQGGNTDTFPNGQNIFPSQGTYTVTLINTYTICTDTLTKTITVLPPPVVSFSASDTGKCQPSLSVNFTNGSNGTSYLWDFGDSTTSTQVSPSHSFNRYGTFDITLIAKGANGCSDTLKKPAYIRIAKPVITFPGLPENGCFPYTVNFNANIQSPDSVTSYLWDFGTPGGTSTLRNPSYTYTAAGTYTVKLTITTRGGCTETYSMANAVKTGPKPTAAFTSNTTSACADPGIQFINQSLNSTEWLWEFSDGTSTTAENPLHPFNDTGRITVSLTAINNGCKDKITKANYAYILPSVSRFDYRPDCSNPLRITFTDRSIGAQTWIWNFGDGTNFTGKTPPPHTYPAPGSYNVTLTTTNGSCSYTVRRTVKIESLTPNFSVADSTGCKPFNAAFTASSPNPGAMTNYAWDFGDGSAVLNYNSNIAYFTYTKAGTYNVTLTTTDTFGCTHTFTKNAVVKVLGPAAEFVSISSNGCMGKTVTFNDSTKTDGTNPVVLWRWDFGDSTGTTTTLPTVQHQYDSIGDYDVKMVVTDSYGCTDSIVHRGFVKISSMKPGFKLNNESCPGFALQYYNETVSDFPFTSLWHFGDGDTSTLKHPIHTYSDTGHFNVQLIVTDIYGCMDSVTIDSVIHVARPRADFDANNFISYCTPFEAKFNNKSYFFYASEWHFGTAYSNQHHPNFYYTATGTYPVELVVTSPGGCKDSITKTITVYNPNDAKLSYSPLTGCTPRQVDFEAFSPMNARFIWDFGDGNVIDTTVNKLTHTYRDYGSFVPVVILKEPSGTCTVALQGDSTILMLGVKPKFGFDTTFHCDSGMVQILDSTTTNDPSITYNWSFGDGGTSNLAAPNHFYSAPGSYMVKLVATTNQGCIDSLTKGPIKISKTPELNVVADSLICVNSKITYTGTLINPDTSQITWLWKFPNGATYNVQNPPPQPYVTPGSFSWSVTATSSSGCRDSAGGNFVVNPLPTIMMPATMTKIIGIPLTIPATYSAGITNYNWSPATTLNCTNCPQPTTTTKFNTKYFVSVTDSNNCTNKSEIQIIVLCKGATVFVPNTFSPNGDGTNDVFFVRGSGLDRVKSLRVFNRWGEVVFEQRDFPSNNQMYGWNGKYKGNLAQPGVYIYQVEVYCENGEVIHFEGNIALIQ